MLSVVSSQTWKRKVNKKPFTVGQNVLSNKGDREVLRSNKSSWIMMLMVYDGKCGDKEYRI